MARVILLSLAVVSPSVTDEPFVIFEGMRGCLREISRGQAIGKLCQILPRMCQGMCRNNANDEVIHLLKLLASASTLATHLLLALSQMNPYYFRGLHSLAGKTEKLKPKRSV